MGLFWTYLDRAVQILAILVLSTLWLKYLGFDVNVEQRLSKTKIGKALHFIIRSTNPVAKMNEEYLEEAGKALANGTKIVAKKIEEEIRMSKLNKWRKEALLFLTYNKKMFTMNLVVGLFALDMYFGWSQKYGLPPDVWYYAAAFIMFFILWAAGGEGWTGNIANRINKDAKQAQKDVQIESKKWKRKLDEVNLKIDEILADKVDGMIPPHLKQNYDELVKSKALYKKKVDELLAKLNPEELT